MDDSTFAILIAFLLGGIVGSALGDALGLVALLTGLATAFTRSVGVLRGLPKKRLERLTAIGFFVGLALSVIAVALDRLITA